MGRAFTVAVCVGLLVAAQSASAADFFRIGAFNIEHLGSRTPGQQPIAIAEHIDLSGVVALALEEIDVTLMGADDPETPADESRRNETLDTSFFILNQEGDTDWRYELFPNRAPADKTQLCGVAWNAKVIKRDSPAFAIEISGPDAGDIWDRRPHAVKLQYGDKTDIVFVPVHMKSNFGSAAQGRATREKEVAALIAGLPAVIAHFNDEEVVIGGDTNFLAADEPAGLLIEEAGYRDTNSLDVPTYIGSGNGAPFDRFFLADKPIFTFARQYVLQATEPVAHDEYLSDHQMVLMSFRVKSDDD